MEPNQQNKQASKIGPETWKQRTESDHRGGRGGQMGKEGEGSSQETGVKDPWTRTMGWGGVGRIECGRGGWARLGRPMG